MKTKTTKRTLLMSALALLVCVSMLIGSTYAWFTDSVVSAGNIIKSGTLDVTMEWADGKEDPASATWKDASEGAIFNYSLWEPGYTQVRHVRIANAGTLALKYQLKIVANGDVSKLADVIDVYYSDPAQKLASRDAITGEPLATLADALAGMDSTAAGNLLPGEAHAVTIALKMQELAGNEYQDLEIGANFSIVLVATQLTAEEDSFDDQYDVDAEYPTVAASAAELKDAIAAGGKITLGGDLNLGGEQLTIAAGQQVTLDLNGNDLSGEWNADNHYAMFTVAPGGELTIVGEGNVTAETAFATSNRFGAIFANSGKLTIEGGNYSVNDQTSGQSMIISTIVDNRTTSASSEAVLTINGGTFAISGNAINLFRNYPQQGGSATIIFNDGQFQANPNKDITYIWNHADSTAYPGELYFNGGSYDAKIVYEDYNGQSDIFFANGTVVPGYSGNN